MAFLSQIQVGGHLYIYLTEYVGNQDYTSKKEKHIYSFGNVRYALGKMKRMMKRFDMEFPEELKEKGYTKQDLLEWIISLETELKKKGYIKQYLEEWTIPLEQKYKNNKNRAVI